MHTTMSGTAQTLTTVLRNMYDTIEVHDVSVEILMEVVQIENTSYEELLEFPFDQMEIH